MPFLCCLQPFSVYSGGRNGLVISLQIFFKSQIFYKNQIFYKSRLAIGLVEMQYADRGVCLVGLC